MFKGGVRISPLVILVASLAACDDPPQNQSSQGQYGQSDPFSGGSGVQAEGGPVPVASEQTLQFDPQVRNTENALRCLVVASRLSPMMAVFQRTAPGDHRAEGRRRFGAIEDHYGAAIYREVNSGRLSGDDFLTMYVRVDREYGEFIASRPGDSFSQLGRVSDRCYGAIA